MHNNHKLFRILLALAGIALAVLALAAISPAVLAQSADSSKVVVYFFWGDGCPHCSAQKPFMQELAGRYPQVDLRMFEVWYNDTNRATFDKMARSFGFEPKSVPTTFVGTKYWIGFDDSLKGEIENVVKSCIQSGCPDAGGGAIPSQPAPVGWILLAVLASIVAVGAAVMFFNRRRSLARAAARRRKR